MADIKEAVQWAKKNPNDPRSIELRRRIESGALNSELQGAGMQPTSITEPRFTAPDSVKRVQPVDDVTLQGIVDSATEAARGRQTLRPKTFVEDTAEDISRETFGLVEDLTKRGEKVFDIAEKRRTREKDVSAKEFAKTLGEGFDILGQTAGAGVDIIERALSLGISVAVPPEQEKKFQESLGKLMNTQGGRAALDALSQGQEIWGQFKENNPELAQKIESAANIVELFGLGVAGKQVQRGGEKAVEVARETAPVARETLEKAGETAEQVIDTTLRRIDEIKDNNRLRRISADEAKINETVGRVVQGKKKDVEKARRALSEIDTTDVKTYEELGIRIEDRVESLSRTLDRLLDEEDAAKGILSSQQLVKTTTVGGTKVSQNYVVDALDQLEELYDVVKSPAEKARIINLKQKLDSEGLFRKEINDLAREYGRVFGSKAFSKTGDPLTSVNAQAFENTRKGLKSTFRDTLDGDEAKILDGRASDLLETNRLVGKMEEKVNQLFQRAKSRGLLERIGRGLADIVNVATFNTLSGFLSRMLPSNVGLKIMNALDIQTELRKNLKIIERLVDRKATDEQIIKNISEMVSKQSRVPTDVD